LQAPTGLSREEQRQFKALNSMSLTRKTWSAYNTAERMLAKCCKEKRLKFEWPVPETTITKFVLWLAFDRNLNSNSIGTYLAGIRQSHINRGIEEPKIRTDRITQLLKGKANLDREKQKERRKPVTPDILRLIKARINDSDLVLIDKRMVWSAVAILFFGAMRGNELLCRNVQEFDPTYTLCTEDVAIVAAGSQQQEWRRYNNRHLSDWWRHLPSHSLQKMEKHATDMGEETASFQMELRETPNQRAAEQAVERKAGGICRRS
jgi:hypothetical protein